MGFALAALLRALYVINARLEFLLNRAQFLLELRHPCFERLHTRINFV